MNQIEQILQRNLNAAQNILMQLLADKEAKQNVVKAIELMATCLKNGGKIYSCGNGGSMCDAMHFAEELTGRFQETRKPFAAMAISDASYISCVANDFGYVNIFSRFIEAHGRKGDILLAISTSGGSPNVLAAAKMAKSLGVSVVGLSGKKISALDELCNIHIATPSSTYADRTQELHIKVIHSMIEGIEALVGG